MSRMASLRQSPWTPGFPARTMREIATHLAVCRRFVRAGSEIGALLSLDDRQLEARGLTRANVGPMILARRGLALNAST